MIVPLTNGREAAGAPLEPGIRAYGRASVAFRDWRKTESDVSPVSKQDHANL